MSITELELNLREIAWTYDQRNLLALRAKFQCLLKANKITASMYHGLNKDIRDRSDWLRSRR